MDLAENAVRILEKISVKYAERILEEGSLNYMMEMMDFFEV